MNHIHKRDLQLFDLLDTATPEQIRARYRILALKWHPDRVGGDARRFREVVEAYERLLNPRAAHVEGLVDMEQYFKNAVEYLRHQWRRHHDEYMINKEQQEKEQEQEKLAPTPDEMRAATGLSASPYVYKMEIDLDDVYHNTKRSFKVKLKDREVKVSFYGSDVQLLGQGLNETIFTYRFEPDIELRFEVSVRPHPQFRIDSLLGPADLYSIEPLRLSLADYYRGTTREIECFGTIVQLNIPAKFENVLEVPGGGQGFKGDLYIRLELRLPDSPPGPDADLETWLKS